MENAILPATIRESLKVTIRGSWNPPTFDAAFTYIRKCVARKEEIVLLCRWNEDQLEIWLTGYVVCRGIDKRELRGQGNMSIMKDGKTTKLDIKVLGSVFGFGTAVLIDGNDDIWLYNPPDTLLPPLPDFPQKAVIVLKKGETGGIHKTLILDDRYDAVVEINESE